MTPTDRDHLDDEVLSAVLDGEATADESLHADACAACAARLGELRDASMLVRAPVPAPDAARREEAIEAALAVAHDAPVASNVVPLRRRMPPAWLAAAAVVAIVLALVAVLSSVGGGDDDQVATGDADEAAGQIETLDDSAAGATEMMMAPPVIDGGDLGELRDADLKAAIERGFAERSAGAGGTGGGDTSAPEEATADEAAVPCDDTVRAGNPQLPTLVYRATGTFEGDPVIVLAYDVPSEDGTRRWVYVVAVEGCVIRNQQTYVV